MAVALTDEHIDFACHMDDVRAAAIAEGSAKLLDAILKARGAVKKPTPVQMRPVARPVQAPIPLRRVPASKALWPRWYRPPGNVMPIPSDTIGQVAAEFGLTKQDIHGPGRSQHLIEARAACISVFRRRGMSYPMIGRVMQRDHSSIISLFNKLPQLELRNPIITRTVLKFAS